MAKAGGVVRVVIESTSAEGGFKMCMLGFENVGNVYAGLIPSNQDADRDWHSLGGGEHKGKEFRWDSLCLPHCVGHPSQPRE